MAWHSKALEIKQAMAAQKSGEITFDVLKQQVYAALKRQCFAEFEAPDEFLKVRDLDEFDLVLDRLYDYCDARRIWLGV